MAEKVMISKISTLPMITITCLAILTVLQLSKLYSDTGMFLSCCIYIFVFSVQFNKQTSEACFALFQWYPHTVWLVRAWLIKWWTIWHSESMKMKKLTCECWWDAALLSSQIWIGWCFDSIIRHDIVVTTSGYTFYHLTNLPGIDGLIRSHYNYKTTLKAMWILTNIKVNCRYDLKVRIRYI